MQPDSVIETLQNLGFTQYEAQCYLGLVQQHPLNGSQLSLLCGVPRSMVYQTLARLEEKAAVVRLSGPAGDPQQYEPMAPTLLLPRLSAQFQRACDQAQQQLTRLMQTPPAEVVLNLVGTPNILQQAAFLVRHAQQRVSVMGASSELAVLEADLSAAVAQGRAARIVSFGSAPAVAGQVVTYPSENVSAPTRFLLVIADTVPVLLATFPPEAPATAVLTENALLARLLSAFLTTEYYIVRVSNQYPAQIGQMLEAVLEPEDRDRYAGVLQFLVHQAHTPRPASSERENHP